VIEDDGHGTSLTKPATSLSTIRRNQTRTNLVERDAGN
jgi:hypothetical protein